MQYVAIYKSSEFCKAVRDNLPKAKVRVDHFHVIQRAILMIMQVRRRSSHEVHERRGRAADPALQVPAAAELQLGEPVDRAG